MTFPAADDLKRLFVDPKMFDSREQWAKAGFDVRDRDNDDKPMIASHPAAPGYFFKKYANAVSPSAQLENYTQRIKGADAMRAFIAERHLQHVVVPQKQLIELPSNFSLKKKASYVLVVERFDLLDNRASKRAYHSIAADVLEAVCTVLYRFRGLDSGARNVPFTTDARIAFIDTERWNDDREKFLKHIYGYMSSEGQALSKKIYKKLMV